MGVVECTGDGALVEGKAEADLLVVVEPFVPLVLMAPEEVVGFCEEISDSNRRSFNENFKFSGASGDSGDTWIGITFGLGFGATGGGAAPAPAPDRVVVDEVENVVIGEGAYKKICFKKLGILISKEC